MAMSLSWWGRKAMAIVTAISCFNAAIVLVGLVKTSVNKLSHAPATPTKMNKDKPAFCLVFAEKQETENHLQAMQILNTSRQVLLQMTQARN